MNDRGDNDRCPTMTIPSPELAQVFVRPALFLRIVTFPLNFLMLGLTP